VACCHGQQHSSDDRSEEAKGKTHRCRILQAHKLPCALQRGFEEGATLRTKETEFGLRT
jgi:hypothetical protein